MTTPTANPWRARGPLHFAHQGGAGEAPANTLYAFTTALDAGATALELDVHCSVDGHLVVIHDDAVDAVTDGAGQVKDLTLQQLQRLDAAHRFTPAVRARGGPTHPFRGVATGRTQPPAGFGPHDFRIPLLADVLDAFPGVPLNIDIKATAPRAAPYEAALARLLAAHGRGDDTMVASFHDAALAAFAATGHAVCTSAGPGLTERFWAAVQEGEPGIDLSQHRALQVPLRHEGFDVVTPAFVAAAHSRDVAVHVWTIDDEPTMRWLLELGVDGIMTDRPTVLARVLGERPRRVHRRPEGD